MIRCKFTPLLRGKETFSEVHITLPSMPDMDFDLNGGSNWALSLLLSGFKRLVLLAVQFLLRCVMMPRKLVLPNPATATKVVQRGSSGSERVTYAGGIRSISLTQPSGLLRLGLVSGRSIYPKEDRFFAPFLSRANPYCVLSFRARQTRTKTVIKSTTANWDKVVYIPITKEEMSSSDSEIKIELFDWAPWTKLVAASNWCAKEQQQLLGFTTLNVGKVVAAQEVTDWYYVAGAGDAQIQARIDRCQPKSALK